VTLTAPKAGRVLKLELHGIVVRLVCSDAETLQALDERFAACAAAAGPGADVTVVYDVDGPLHDEPRDGRVVYESEHARAVYSPREDALYAFHADGGSLRCEPCAGQAELVAEPGAHGATWLLTRPLLTLALMESLRERALYPLHAAALAGPRGGVLVSGASGTGKSTLALALVAAGLDYLGDDLAFLRDGGNGVELLGFPDEIGVVGGEPRPGWPKARLPLADAVPAGRIRAGCDPCLVLLLAEAGGPAPEPVDADTALLELLPSILLTAPPRIAGHLDALAKLTASATLWRVEPRPDLDGVVERVVAEVGAAHA
jgi:hypothetical protein